MSSSWFYKRATACSCFLQQTSGAAWCYYQAREVWEVVVVGSGETMTILPCPDPSTCHAAHSWSTWSAPHLSTHSVRPPGGGGGASGGARWWCWREVWWRGWCQWWWLKGLSASAPPDAPHIAPRALIRDNELLNEQVREMSGVCCEQLRRSGVLLLPAGRGRPTSSAGQLGRTRAGFSSSSAWEPLHNDALFVVVRCHIGYCIIPDDAWWLLLDGLLYKMGSASGCI